MKPVYPKKRCVVCLQLFETNRSKRGGSKGIAYGVKRPINAVTCSKNCSKMRNSMRDRGKKKIKED